MEKINYVYNSKVSIIIICMNNLKLLYPCLDSIKKYTKCSYELFVVAYLFSKDNLESFKKRYPWVTIIESNEIRGFSENNNLALKQAKGEYCFILNDDTLMEMPVIDSLLKDYAKLPEAATVISPVILKADKTIQFCGRPKEYFIYNFLVFYHLEWIRCFFKNRSKYVNRKGLFQTYNISGACFLIKTEVFHKMGLFDERYFFCPEDIALSEKLNRNGYLCYVDGDVQLIHYGGQTYSLSRNAEAILPADDKGLFIWACGNNVLKKIVYLLYMYVTYSIYGIYHYLKFLLLKSSQSKIKSNVFFNTIKTIGSNLTPKEIFIKYYMGMHNGK